MNALTEDPRLRHGRIKEILFEASLLTGEERRAFLMSSCAGDPAMLAEVESLLAHHDDVPSEGVGVEATLLPPRTRKVNGQANGKKTGRKSGGSAKSRKRST